MFEGRIDLIIGPMFSGKSSELQRIVRRYLIAHKSCLVINYISDNRYSAENVVTTHDMLKMDAVKVEHLANADLKAQDHQVIAVDEGQFFSDLEEYADKWANEGKIVVVAALESTFERKPFGQVCKLISKAETVVKLSAVCLECRGLAYFTFKLNKEEKKVNDIGGIEKYHPACRKCYLKFSSDESP